MYMKGISRGELENQLTEARLEIEHLREEITLISQNPAPVSKEIETYLPDYRSRKTILLNPEFEIVSAKTAPGDIPDALTEPEIIPGKSIFEYYPKDQYENLTSLVKASLAGKSLVADIPILLNDNRKYWMRHHFSPSRIDGGKTAVVFINSYEIPEAILPRQADLTKSNLHYRSKDQSLLLSEQKFHSFIEQAAEGIFLVDEEGRIIEWNKGLESITGISAREAIDQSIWKIFERLNPSGKTPFQLPDYSPKNIIQVLRTVESPRYNKLQDLEIWTPSGEHKFTQITIFPIRTAEDFVVGAITHDITTIRQHQKEMETILELNKTLRPLSSMMEMLPVIGTKLMALLNLAGTAVTIYDQDHEENRVLFAAGCWKKLTGQNIPPEGNSSSQVIRNSEIYLNNDTGKKPEISLPDIQSIHPKAVACLPLSVREKVLGTVWIGQSYPINEDTLRISKIICEITAAAMHRSSLHEQLQRRLDHTSALRLIDRTITSNLDLKIGLHVLLDQVVFQLDVDAVAIHLINSRTQNIEFGEARGFRTDMIKRTYLSIGEGLAGRAVLERNVLFIPDLETAADKFTRKALRVQEEFVTYCAAPLIIKGEVKGVMELFKRSAFTPSAEWLEFLENLAGQAAIMIDNAELFSRLQQSNLELRLAYSRTLEGWVKTLELRDEETEGHTQRVTEMTLRLAIAMGISEDRLIHIQRGALLHDIGKMAVSDNILRKPGELTSTEWEVIRQHPIVAYNLLRPITFLQDALDIPYCHHERWDGSGYPRGLKEDEIPLAARIFAVVDVWDALTCNRHYRKAWSKEEAFEYIKTNSGKLFDPKVVDIFTDLLEIEGESSSSQRIK